MVLYLTYWIPAAERARTNALFMTAAPVSVIVGAPLSEALLKLDGLAGLHGWQWLFLLEGLPAVMLGVLALRVLTDRPEQAAWLPPTGSRVAGADDERGAGAARRDRPRLDRPKLHAAAASGCSARVYFMNTSVTYGIFLWLPRMLVEASGASGFGLSALTAIPFVAALIAMVLVGRHSDRTGERKLHVAACAITAAIGLLLAVAFRNNVWLLVLSFTLSQMGQRSVMSVFWAMPPMLLGGARRRRRHRADQRGRQPRRILRPVDHGNASGPDRRLQRRPAGARGRADRRSHPRSSKPAASPSEPRRGRSPSWPGPRR